MIHEIEIRTHAYELKCILDVLYFPKFAISFLY